MSISHKIIVMQRIIEYHFKNRHDKYSINRRLQIRDCIKTIRRLQTNPTDKDKYE